MDLKQLREEDHKLAHLILKNISFARFPCAFFNFLHGNMEYFS